MRILSVLFSVLPVLIRTSASAYSLNPDDYAADQVVRSDVAVIGGGSSGTYTAVRLKDKGHTVTVIEEKPVLGGHAQTYRDPINNYTIDIGVVVFDNKPIVTNYFKRFSVPLILVPDSSSTPHYVNPSTGEFVKGFTPPNSSAFHAALDTYSKQLAKYPQIQNGFVNLTYPVEAELLEPFSKFLTKYNLGALFPSVYVNNQGYVPILEVPTLYMLKYLDPEEVGGLRNGFLTTKNHDIAALYQAAGRYLGSNSSNVLLSSHVMAMNRTSDKVSLAVKTPSGTKLVISKKLVSAIPPTLSSLKAYDLTSNEKSLFGQFFGNGYATSVLNNTGLTAGMDANAVDPSRPFSVPTAPNPYGFSVNAGTNLTQIYYASQRPQSDATVKAEIIASLEKFQKAQGLKERGGDFLAFSNHAPFNLMVTTDAIQKGFYRELDALNGQLSTYWNGAAFETQASTNIWQYTESTVLPRVLAGLK